MRFFISPPHDSVDNAFLSCVIPGGLGYPTSGDTTGRKVTIQGLDNRGSRITYIQDMEHIPHWLTLVSTADVIEFTGDAADDIRGLVEENRFEAVLLLFLALQYEGYLADYLANDEFNDFVRAVLERVTEEALKDAILEALEGYGAAAYLAVSLWRVWSISNVVTHIVESTGDLYLVFPNYPEYELEPEGGHFYRNGLVFAADDLTAEKLAEVEILSGWLLRSDCLYFESLDEAATNPDGTTLGKANCGLWGECTRVPNNWVRPWYQVGPWEPPWP